jgi:MFS family permease
VSAPYFPAVSHATAITYRYERWRALSSGILESAGTTFLLTIAVRGYHSGPFWKAAIAGGSSFGLLLTPVVVSLVTNRALTPSRAASRLFFIGAGCFLAAFAAALAGWLPLYAIGSMLAMASAAAVIPLFTHIYQENYPETQRGRLFSRTMMIRIASAAAFSAAGGWLLSRRFEVFPSLVLLFGAVMAFSGFCLAKIPSEPIHDDGGAHPFRAMRYVRSDPIFRRTLICWMLMGFANLMMLPLRVEYLANPKYNVQVSGPFVDWFSRVAPHAAELLFSPVGIVALATGLVPNLARLIMSPVWGWLFDRVNFFALRVTLNTGFAIGILTFFVSNSFSGLVIGAIIFGISNAGGDVAWSLWVTKFAPPGRVADYMSVHTFFTGVRGVLAPVFAFTLVAKLSLGLMAAMSAGLIVAASLLLLPEIKFGKRARKATALVEEISE